MTTAQIYGGYPAGLLSYLKNGNYKESNNSKLARGERVKKRVKEIVANTVENDDKNC